MAEMHVHPHHVNSFRIFYDIQSIRELGSNYLLISCDFKNCMVIRAIYFKVFALANR